MSKGDKFFKEIGEQSEVKSAIVEKYFDAWARIVTAVQKRHGRGEKIGYIDLFAGPGRYEDGAASTPLKILTKAIESDDYRGRLVTNFNDRSPDSVASLKAEIDKLPGIETLGHKPRFNNTEVGDELAAMFEGMNTIPLLVFIDPWGYKGLSLRLVNAVLKNWGCDCIFFFNYNRINAGLSNPYVKTHMAALFGEERADRLAKELKPMTPAEREATIVNELAMALKEHAAGDRFTLPFCFKNKTGARTTHHLILVTKHFKGYEVMKEIMAKMSTAAEQGVASFSYSPATGPNQPLLFSLNRPLDDLQGDLLVKMKGRTLTMVDVYKSHCVDTPYIKKNYKDALKKLEADGRISAAPPAEKRRKNTFADTVMVTFP